MQIKSAKDLIVYQKAYALAMEIFEASGSFPAEERYSLVDQIRRSSRSVCTNLREAWAKRKYEAHFVSKLTDAGRMLKLTPGSISLTVADTYRAAII
jgi:23S rRNA-intervening sequence protein